MNKMSRAIAALMLAGAGTASAVPITLSQSMTFPEIRAREFLVGTEGTFSLSAWSSIDYIEMIFASADPDFLLGVGPTGGASGVEIAVITESGTPTRVGISSVVPGNQLVPLYPGSGDPLARYELVRSLLLDGMLTVSLGSFENFPGCCSFGFPLDQSSSLTLRVTGERRVSVPEPSSIALLGLGLCGLALVWRRRSVK